MKPLFFAMPRTASTYIASILNAVNVQYIGHASRIDAVRDIKRYTKKGYQIFTFVRNPFTRLASAYLYISEGGRGNALDMGMQAIVEDYGSFEAFCSNIEEATANKHAIHFYPQHSWLTEDVKVGGYETLHEDYDRFAEELGFNPFWPQRKDTKPKDYKEFYENVYDRVAEKIVNYYKKDFELFGYEENYD